MIKMNRTPKPDEPMRKKPPSKSWDNTMSFEQKTAFLKHYFGRPIDQVQFRELYKVVRRLSAKKTI